MVDRATTLDTALTFMERALELLDDASASLPALHLQMAIDQMTGAPIPRTVEEADAMMDTPKMRALMERLARSARRADDDQVVAPEHTPEAIARAAELVQLYGAKALGRVRMQLYEAMGRQEPAEVNRLAEICSVLMRGGART